LFDPWKIKHGLWKRHSGGIDFMNPQPEQIHIDDLAECLSRECRWSGSVPISVAEHSVKMAEALPLEYKIYALLHDSPEAYTGDIPSPIKACLRVTDMYVDGGGTFVQLEERILVCICKALNVPYDKKKFDTVLEFERTIFDLEISLDPDRFLRSEYWQTRWKGEVFNAIRLLDGSH
jgi:hypothetical protein